MATSASPPSNERGLKTGFVRGTLDAATELMFPRRSDVSPALVDGMLKELSAYFPRVSPETHMYFETLYRFLAGPNLASITNASMAGLAEDAIFPANVERFVSKLHHRVLLISFPAEDENVREAIREIVKRMNIPGPCTGPQERGCVYSILRSNYAIGVTLRSTSLAIEQNVLGPFVAQMVTNEAEIEEKAKAILRFAYKDVGSVFLQRRTPEEHLYLYARASGVASEMILEACKHFMVTNQFADHLREDAPVVVSSSSPPRAPRPMPAIEDGRRVPSPSSVITIDDDDESSRPQRSSPSVINIDDDDDRGATSSYGGSEAGSSPFVIDDDDETPIFVSSNPRLSVGPLRGRLEMLLPMSGLPEDAVGQLVDLAMNLFEPSPEQVLSRFSHLANWTARVNRFSEVLQSRAAKNPEVVRDMLFGGKPEYEAEDMLDHLASFLAPINASEIRNAVSTVVSAAGAPAHVTRMAMGHANDAMMEHLNGARTIEAKVSALLAASRRALDVYVQSVQSLL